MANRTPILTRVTVSINGQAIATSVHNSFTEAWEVYNFPADAPDKFKEYRSIMKEQGSIELRSRQSRKPGWKTAYAGKVYLFEVA